MVEDDDAGSSGPAEERSLPFADRRVCAARVSDELITPATGRTAGGTQRHDGWTPDRQLTFLDTLAGCGVVTDAARAAGMSVRSAYNFRNRAEGAPFAVAWNAAQLRARRRLEDVVHSRALHGCVELVMKDGEVVVERHRFDNRLTMAALARLDRLAEAGDDASRAARYVEQEFDQFVALVVQGGTGAAEFIASREAADAIISSNDTARNLARLESYRRHGEGLRDELRSGAALAPSDPSVDSVNDNASGAAASTEVEPGEVDAEPDAPRMVVTWLPVAGEVGEPLLPPAPGEGSKPS